MPEIVTEVEKLVTEGERLLKEVADHTIQCGEGVIRTIEHDLADPTQLRVAVHRLGLFRDHLNSLVADEPVRQAREEAGEPDLELESLTRKQLDRVAKDLGIEAPDKLKGGKAAVVAAIREARGASGDDEPPDPDEAGEPEEEASGEPPDPDEAGEPEEEASGEPPDPDEAGEPEEEASGEPPDPDEAGEPEEEASGEPGDDEESGARSDRH